jgi:hypothetical protein
MTEIIRAVKAAIEQGAHHGEYAERVVSLQFLRRILAALEGNQENNEAKQSIKNMLIEIQDNNRLVDLSEVIAKVSETVLVRSAISTENATESFEGYLRRRLGDNYSAIVIAALDALRDENADDETLLAHAATREAKEKA